jgi:hypothetical protein
VTSDAKRLVLCHASADTTQAVERLTRLPGSVTWIFLGEEYAARRKWEGALSPVGERRGDGVALQRTAERLRRPFLELIADLGARHQSLAWWSSRVSERNVHVSRLFLNCCYASLAASVIRENAGTICVVATDRAVLEAVAGRADLAGTDVIWLGGARRGVEAGRRSVRIARRIARFLWSAVRRSRTAPDAGGGRRPDIVIRTWVDEGCLTAEGGFRDRYFDGLADWLRSLGYEVTTIPVLFNLMRSQTEAWRTLARTGRSFLAPERFYRMRDYLFALRIAFQQTQISLGDVSLEAEDVTALFEAERKRFAFDSGSLDAILSHRLPLRLADKGFTPSVFIDPYENMIPEKSLILGFRRYLPDTKLVGYQHSTVPPMLLCNFVTAREARCAPLPDRVVCSGTLFRDVLVSEGLPGDLAVVGPALRFAHLWSQPPRDLGADPAAAAVLVPLPLGVDPAIELLRHVIDAFEACTNLEVRVKPHPMLAFTDVLSLAGVDLLPAHFSISTASMEEALQSSQVVVSFGSSALYEAAAAGVPVLVVARESGLDLNPLAWYSDLGEVHGTPAELRDAVARLRAIDPAERGRYEAEAQRLREDLGQVNDQTMSVFTARLIEAAR